MYKQSESEFDTIAQKADEKVYQGQVQSLLFLQIDRGREESKQCVVALH